MNWQLTADIDDRTMREHARDRRLVRTKDGYIAKLAAWPGPKRKASEKGRFCRLETRSGSRFTLPCADVTEVDVPRE